MSESVQPSPEAVEAAYRSLAPGHIGWHNRDQLNGDEAKAQIERMLSAAMVPGAFIAVSDHAGRVMTQRGEQ